MYYSSEEQKQLLAFNTNVVESENRIPIQVQKDLHKFSNIFLEESCLTWDYGSSQSIYLKLIV
jgi:hypothetical protein